MNRQLSKTKKRDNKDEEHVEKESKDKEGEQKSRCLQNEASSDTELQSKK